MRALLILPLVAALGGCVTAGAVPVTGNVPVIRTKVDLTIGQAANLLSENCTRLQAGLNIGELFVSNVKVRAAIDKAQLALGSYCSGPPPAYRAVLAVQPAH